MMHETIEEAKTFKIENTNLIFKNFQGKATRYSGEGMPNTGVVVPENIASAMKEDGWKVKQIDQGGSPTLFYVTAWMRPGSFPNPEWLDKNLVGPVDVILRGFRWHINEKTGVKAYLKWMEVK